MKRLIAVALVFVASCKDRPASPTVGADAPKVAMADAEQVAAPAPVFADVEAFDDTYGIYFQGQKVGWMRSTFTQDGVLSTELYAKVGGMGQVSEVRFDEKRTYAADKKLARITFSQSAATGAVQVVGERRGEMLKVTTTAGGKGSSEEVAVEETIDDALELQKLAKAQKVGATATSKRYDPSIQKIVTANHVISALEKKAFGGVETEVVKIDTSYPDLGIAESAWVDAKGKTLESRIGGFFVARLEPPEEAKRLDYSQDLLVSAVVAVPKPIDKQADLKKLSVRFSGFAGVTPPPQSKRQVLTWNGEDLVLALTKDSPPKQAWSADKPLAAESPADLAATAFVQSTDPEIIAAAKAAAGDATDVYTATTRLAQFVYAYIEDEYVPAYSNALEALKSRRGDCTEHSVLFVALARALGIPARVAVGIAYWQPGHGFGWHAWAEVYAGGAWYAVDPTWNQPIADVTHVKLADGGPAEQARIVMLLGRLRVVDVRT